MERKGSFADIQPTLSWAETSMEDNINGQWQAISGVLAGKTMAEDIVSATKLTINQTNTYEVDLAGVIDRGSLIIQNEFTPVRLTIQCEQGPNAGKTFLAILEFMSESKMRIAYDLSGTSSPESFEPSEDDCNYVATFERIEMV